MQESKVRAHVLNILFIVFSVSLLSSFLGRFFADYPLSSWNISEFLINYQDGFVRRGLLGEILFRFVQYTGCDLQLTVKIFCAVFFFILCFLFIRKFQSKGYALYIIPLCFLLGGPVMGNFWIRKDCFLTCLFLFSIYCLYSGRIRALIWRICIVNIVCIIAILTHEVFAFFSFPLLFFLLINSLEGKLNFKKVFYAFVSLSPAILIFLLSSINHGDITTAQSIWDSWAALLGIDKTTVSWDNALGGLGWSVSDAIQLTFERNFYIDDYGVASVFYLIITFAVIYYISVNFLFVFKSKKTCYDNDQRTLLSGIIIFQFFCIFPLLLTVFCDFDRIIYYWITFSFIVFLFVPSEKLVSLFPKMYYNTIKAINIKIDSFFYPSKKVLLLLMLIIGVSRVSFTLSEAYSSTMIFRILYVLSKPFDVLIDKLG